MPNWCDNTLTVHGKVANDLLKFVKSVKGKGKTGEAFDFNKIVPMPPELMKVCTGGCKIGDKYVTKWWTTGKGKNAKNVEIPEAILRSYQTKYGATDWYEWATANWDTKWNALDPTVRVECGVATFTFRTAWGAPLKVIDKLAEKWPDLRFELVSHYEDDGDAAMKWNEGAA